MSLTDAVANELLNHILRNADLANIGDATGLRGSTAAGNTVIALHTADPGVSGTQSTSEVSYTGYARVNVARSAAGWDAAASRSAQNAALIQFGQRTDVGTAEATHFTVGGEGGKIFLRGHIGVTTSMFAAVAATNDDIEVPGHTFAVNDRVTVRAIAGQALPTGITEGAIYHIITVTSDVVTISATQGGAAINITAAGGMYIGELSPLSITLNVRPEFAAGALKVKL